MLELASRVPAVQMLIDPCFRVEKMDYRSFRGSISGLGFAYCDFYQRNPRTALTGRPGAVPPPPTTALGALLAHISGGADAKTFQPMNVNFGLFPELAGRGRDRKKALAQRALADLDAWLGKSRQAAE